MVFYGSHNNPKLEMRNYVTYEVKYGRTHTLRSNPFERSGYTFIGWALTEDGPVVYEENQRVKNLTDNGKLIDLYAVWQRVTIVPGATLYDKLVWLNANALSGQDYTVEVTSNESISPTTLSKSSTAFSVTLKGITELRTISLSTNGSLFTVGSGVTLILDENICLQGRANNTEPLIQVNTNGTLVMNTGSQVIGNTATSDGGGIRVEGGTFTMNGGTISGNTVSSVTGSASGGGVYITAGTTQTGGTGSGTFTMNGGTISNNTISSVTSTAHGGGVYIDSGTFTMNGGTISGNTATASVSTASGGGVYLAYGRTLVMNNGAISGNTASATASIAYGGGVYGGTEVIIAISGGAISGNTASGFTNAWGGGVYVDDSGSSVSRFTKTAGSITGYATDPATGNKAWDSSANTEMGSANGHAVYIYNSNSSYVKHKETTAGSGGNLVYNRTSSSGAWD